MKETHIDPDEAERLAIAHSESFASERGWEYMDLKEPEDDLLLFFKHIPGTKVLDVGCGWGRYVYRFQDRGLKYIGIDHSPAMISIAREMNPDMTFEVMSYRGLTFPDKTFDGLWCCCSFNSEPKHNMPSVLHGLRRVLAPRGVIMVVMPNVHGCHEELAVDASGKPIGWYASYTLTELLSLLQQAGFEKIECNYRDTEGAMSILVRKR